MEEDDDRMKDVIIRLLGFYVAYRTDLHGVKKRFWTMIDREWFHKPMSHDDFMKLMRGENK